MLRRRLDLRQPLPEGDQEDEEVGGPPELLDEPLQGVLQNLR